MFSQLMNQFKSTQKEVEKTRKRLDDVLVRERSVDQMITVTVNANRRITDIKVQTDEIEDNEQLEDYLITTINKAMEKADAIHEEELQNEAKKGLPDIPGITS